MLILLYGANVFHTFKKDSLCSIPPVFYPTTVFLLDDDESFLRTLSKKLKEKYSIRCFSDAKLAVETIKSEMNNFNNGDYLSERFDGNILVPRKEVLNPDRFKRHIITVFDEYMPHISGLSLMRDVAGKGYETNKMQFFILLTMSRESDIEKLREYGVFLPHSAISKLDKDYVKKLESLIDKYHQEAFQYVGCDMAGILAQALGKKGLFYVWKFLPILNAYFKEHNVCEGYLFDSQDSMMFLDRKGNLSWLIVRNEDGIENGIKTASQYGAPQKIIEAMKSKEYILSLYEDEDFKSKQNIQWDQYLLKANVFKDDSSESKNEQLYSGTYYYAFTNQFHEHGIDTSKILSYEAFLNQQKKNLY